VEPRTKPLVECSVMLGSFPVWERVWLFCMKKEKLLIFSCRKSTGGGQRIKCKLITACTSRESHHRWYSTQVKLITCYLITVKIHHGSIHHCINPITRLTNHTLYLSQTLLITLELRLCECCNISRPVVVNVKDGLAEEFLLYFLFVILYIFICEFN